jgi:hypothetical protein
MSETGCLSQIAVLTAIWGKEPAVGLHGGNVTMSNKRDNSSRSDEETPS